MANRVTRREFISTTSKITGLGLAGTTAPALLSSCSRSASNKATLAGTGKPIYGGKLIVGVEAEEDGFDPSSDRFDSTGVCYARTVYDPLAYVARDGSVKPYLAEAIEPSKNYTVWTIKLRAGITFHDGSPLNSAALKLHIDKQLSAFLTSSAYKGWMSSCTVVDDLTVQCNMEQPWVPFNYWLTGYIGGQIAYVPSPLVYQQKNGYSASHPSGTGPFVFKEWVPNSHFRATKNPNYWRKGLPYLDEIEFRPIPDSSQRANSLLSGTVNLIHLDTASDINTLKSSGSITLIDDLEQSFGEPDMDMVMLNLTPGKLPFSNIFANRALAFATNQQKYLETLGGHLEQPTNQPFTKNTIFYATDPQPAYPSFDLSQAKQSVAQYLKTTGETSLTFTLGTTPSPSNNQWAQLMQGMWKEAGINVNINNNIQQSQFIGDAFLGNFEAFLWRQFASIHPDTNYIFWSPSTIFSGGALNFARNNDPLMQNYLDSARRAPTLELAASYYQQAVGRFNADLPYIWVSRVVWALAAGQGVQNFDNPTGPDGNKAIGMLSGIFWPTEIWMDQTDK